MGKYFGTDGFRGEANVQLTAAHGYAIGRFLGWYFLTKQNEKPKIVVGKDPRRSSYMLEYAVMAGMTASGCDAYLLHVTTTPSVSYITRVDRFSAGVMISASHNPFYDNGIKLLSQNGEKMEEGILDLCEAYLDGNLSALGVTTPDLPLAKGEDIGQIIDYVSGRNRYIGYLISTAACSFRSLRVGLDCANGSAWMIARAVFEALGATVYLINAEPSGININQNAGSTHIDGLVELVKREKLDIGFAFDGDGDRCLAVSETGEVITGDHILYLFAKHFKKEGSLPHHTVVATIMSNMGLDIALKKEGIATVKTPVGDKFVGECMAKEGYALGGEQSGHIILSKYAKTGDGILTAVKLADCMLQKEQPISELYKGFFMYPQCLYSVRVKDKTAAMTDPDLLLAKEEAEQVLGEQGRLVLRPSGTEPVIRIMAEAKTYPLAQTAANLIRTALLPHSIVGTCRSVNE